MAKTKKATTKAYSVREMADAVLKALPELSEAFTRADIELAIDDRGWDKFYGGNQASLEELDSQTRIANIRKSRLYWRKDPLAKQAVRTWTNYCFGNGMSYKAEDEAVQSQIDEFFDDRRNRKILSATGQQRLSKKLLVDGDLFFAIFDADGGKKIVRMIDAAQVTDIMSDPDDDETNMVYRRVTATDKTLYYVDWALDDEQKATAKTLKDPKTKKTVVLEEGVVVYHLSFDQLVKWGNGLLFSVVDWSREHRRFMEARVAITQALAKFAWKGQIKGGQGALNAVQARLQSSLVTTGTQGGAERNPQNAPGASWLQNTGVDLTPMPRVTGAGDAKMDGDALKLMVSAGTGIMLHYFGDPSTGNLATATAMELPMLKQFEAYQKLWEEAFRDLISIVLDEQPDDEPAVVDIDLPAILEKDLTALGGFITAVTSVFPELKLPELMKMILATLEVNNIDDVLKAAADARVKIDKQQADMLAVQAAQPAMTPAQQAQVKESYDNLAKAFIALSEKL